MVPCRRGVLIERTIDMTTVYIRMKKSIVVEQDAILKLKDIAYITTSSTERNAMDNLPLYHVTKKDEQYVVMDSFYVIRFVQEYFPTIAIEIIGGNETVVQIKEPKRRAPILFVGFVWLIFFVGTAMTIMNFHYDVSMQEVQQKIHYIFTGNDSQHPLIIQIPYSIGLGIGMILFLNHWFKKRFNEEPSPLELELFQYKQDVHEYIAYYENELNDDDPI